MDWPRLLAYITGTVDQELLLRNEYLVAENRILKAQIKARLRLSDAERTTLAEIGHRLGRQALEEVAAAAKPDTILGWYRKLIANKFDGSKARRTQGRPRIDEEMESLVVGMAKENPSWGYDRIVGALANLGHKLSDQTVGNILRRHDVPPAPKRKHTTRWKDFIRAHLDVLAGTDFFTVEVVTLKGLVTYYVLFFIHLQSRKVCLAGMTPHPDEEWMQQIARNVTLETWGFLENCKYLLHDRDRKFCPAFDGIIENTNFIIMKKETIKAKRITCCFLGRLKRWGVIRNRFNVRSDWEVCLSTTIGRQHEEQSRQADSGDRILPGWVYLVGPGCAQADGYR
jgi:Homeodomain-like domain